MRLKIGEFARLGEVSVQTLRYYDDIHLLKPAEVDPYSGYRYYTLEQLPDLARILSLKDLGFALDQIQPLLSANFSAAELRRQLLLKRQEVNRQVQEQLDRLDRLDARLRLLDQGMDLTSYEIVLKRVEAIQVASVRGVIPTFWEVNPLWEKLSAGLEAWEIKPCGPYFTLCHAVEPEINVEVCAPIPDAAASHEDLHVWQLPVEEKMACTYHHGSFTGLATAFTALLLWVDTNGFEIAGPDREIYLRLPQDGQYHNDPDAVTELQIPVKRKEN